MKKILIQIDEYFKNLIGLNPDTVGKHIWQRALKERMKLCEIEDEHLYFKKLISSPDETQEFIELIVVPETWFFRDKASLDYIKEFFIKELFKIAKGKTLKILSLPCASGEEPYSIVMALLDLGISSNQFTIDAVDISKRLLAKAKIGLYGKNSFRGTDLFFRERYFEKTEHGYLIKPTVKSHVRFFYGNIADPNFLNLFRSQYDIVFCRNLLIYLHEEAQKQAFKVFDKLLVPNGILVLGPSETELARIRGYTGAAQYKSCAFQKRQKGKDEKTLARLKTAGRFVLKAKEEKENVSASELEKATNLANNGSFEDATAICLDFMLEYGVHPQAYFLLGVIQHARGNEEKAEEFFLKTIYLQPSHHEALVYLALLSERRGDTHNAGLYRQRALKSKTLSKI